MPLRQLLTMPTIMTGVYVVMFRAFDLKRDLDVFRLAVRRAPSGAQPLLNVKAGLRARAPCLRHRSSNITVTLAVMFTSPGATGVDSACMRAIAIIGTGRGGSTMPDSAIEMMRWTRMPAACA